MSENGYAGTERPGAGLNPASDNQFLVEQLINRISTCTLVKIVSVTNSGALSPVGFVDAQPLVNQVDGANNAISHGVLHHLPYFRLQGGANAVIIDPQPGDIGIAVFADHDISSVKASKAQANPGSGGRFSMSDGIYIGGVLNGTPSQFVRFSGEGIEIVSPTKIKFTAPDIEMNATNFTANAATLINGTLAQGTGPAGGGATMQGPITVAEDVIAGGKSLINHVHSGVTSGGSNTGKPV